MKQHYIAVYIKQIISWKVNPKTSLEVHQKPYLDISSLHKVDCKFNLHANKFCRLVSQTAVTLSLSLLQTLSASSPPPAQTIKSQKHTTYQIACSILINLLFMCRQTKFKERLQQTDSLKHFIRNLIFWQGYTCCYRSWRIPYLSSLMCLHKIIV